MENGKLLFSIYKFDFPIQCWVTPNLQLTKWKIENGKWKIIIFNLQIRFSVILLSKHTQSTF